MGAKDNTPLNRLEAACLEAGLRMTGQRRTVVRVLAESEDHPDVEELHRRAVKLDKNVSLSTVYRTVKLLEDRGIITRHAFGDGRSRYERSDEEHHDHIINIKTGEVIEFHSEEIEALKEAIAREYGFRLIDHRLELHCVPLDDKA